MTSGTLSRRALLRGRLSRPPEAIRPPWSRPEGVFASRCARGDDCVAACPEAILARGDGGFPELDPRRGGCTFCGACARACPTDALDATGPDATGHDAGRAPWRVHAVLGPGCLSARGVACRVCGERCPERAIAFRLVVGGPKPPEIDLSACTGCGACVAPCPTGALTIRDQPMEDGHAPGTA